MWPILVKKPNGPWSNCYGGLGFGPPHHRQRHLCLPSSILGLYCSKLFFFQCCPQIMHKICSSSLLLSPLGFEVGEIAFWGWAGGGGVFVFTHHPTECTYLHKSPIHLPKPLLYLLRLSTFPPSNSLPPPLTPKAKGINF